MLSEAQSIADFHHRGIVRGGELYLSVPEARGLLNVCRERDLAVVGAEGFVLKGKALKPRQDMIADGSSIEASTWPEFQKRSNRFAESFLRALQDQPGLVVNLTALPEKDWKEALQKERA